MPPPDWAGTPALIAERLTTGMVIANDRDGESLEMARAEHGGVVGADAISSGIVRHAGRKRWRKRVSGSWTGCWQTWA